MPIPTLHCREIGLNILFYMRFIEYSVGRIRAKPNKINGAGTLSH
jgi:hypothetical protein